MARFYGPSGTGGNANTGDITFDGVQIIGAGTASGDGESNGTIELVPDASLYGNDQYLVIDPTNPNHIHIRAGGTQDDSNGDLILGGERNNVYVEDSVRQVTVSTRYQRIENVYTNANQASNTEFMVETGADIQVGYTVTVGGTDYLVAIVTPGYPYEGLTTVVADGATFVTGQQYTFFLDPVYDNQWAFKSDGSVMFPQRGSNNRTGNGEVLKFGNPATQSIITGSAPNSMYPTAQRLVVAGQDGYTGTSGEGGDVYLWAGRGGSENGSGGDIKLDGGDGDGTGSGGTVKMRGGTSIDSSGGFVQVLGGGSTNSDGGYVEIYAGYSTTGNGGAIEIGGGNSSGDGTTGGLVSIVGGAAGGTGSVGGHVTLSTSNAGKIILSGDGGEFLNNGSIPANQIATIGDLQSNGSWNADFRDSTGTLAGITQTGHYNRVGNMIFFCVNVDFNGYTSLGTGQYEFTLPFAPRQTFTSRGGTLHNPNTDSRYHIAAIVDIIADGANAKAKLYYSGSTTDLAWKYNTPVNWAHNTTHFDMSGFYEIAPA